ncbi:tRNA modification GTPase [Aquimarina sp. M1]
MEKKIGIIIACLLSIGTFGQITFDQGYFITNTNEKVECLIRNNDWKNNPKEIKYKLNEDSEEKVFSTKNCKEFGIDNISKYQRSEVQIDRSSNNTTDLSVNKEPIFNKEVLFLKILIEGEKNLYKYADKNLTRYFYNKDDNTISQLIFKNYINSENKIGKNTAYKVQLWQDLKCNSITIKTINNVGYNSKDLTRFFENYNKCQQSEFTNYTTKQKRDFFNLSFRPGIKSSSLSINNFTTDLPTFSVDFDSKIDARFGIEAEFILPFNRNKWSFFAEPTYQSYKESFTFESGIKVDVDYTSIELPLGIRHYLFLSKQSKLFVNGAVVLDFPLGDAAITYERGPTLDLSSEVNFSYGIGYTYKNTYTIELRNQTIRNVLGSSPSWNSKYNSLSIILGYAIF